MLSPSAAGAVTTGRDDTAPSRTRPRWAVGRPQRPGPGLHHIGEMHRLGLEVWEKWDAGGDNCYGQDMVKMCAHARTNPYFE